MIEEAWVQGAVRRARGGDLEAFGDLSEAFHGSICGFVAMLGVAPDDVEDVAQETFLAAYRELGRFEAGRPFGPWLRGIARNLVRKLRTQTSRTSLQRREIVARLLAAREPEPEEEGFADRFRMEDLRECLRLLPGRATAMVQMRYREGKNSKEIARKMGLSAEAVRMALVRIRLNLRECIGRRLALQSE